ncbi:hypothetical protein E1A91_A07G110100v1 [Gossypium mustelinum]|uniref:Exostosin GT47 domain-containing protein n=1 Tax=Gossypium mustelinum TaxID=34275 RepID=A0A5D2YJX3_GOSMU|nr:hypothetical protein E1A91_A07G110100v1 [Gossypium mustelinum]
MEKPLNGKCPCRTQSWYIVLISFLIWFSLFYLYSSSMTFGKMGDSFLGNNRTGFVGSSESSIHDVVKDETGNASYVNDVKIEDNVGKAIYETENDRKPIKFYIDRDIDWLIASLMADDNETETFETISGKILEEEFRNSSKRRGRIKPVEAVAAATTIPKKVEQVVPQPRTQNVVKPQEPKPQNIVKPEPYPSPCLGRYIFVHDIPRKFNQDLLDNCQSLSSWTDMCESALNLGLGPTLPSNEKLYSKTGWFSTNQFLLEVIFHNRMKQYQCLTNDPMVASAIYVPYYAGLDVGRYLWDPIGYRRDHDAMELVKWLAGRPEWKKMWGRDHFLVAGRINWDFRRDLKNVSDWGNGLLSYPESKNMTMLIIESSPWNNNDFTIPYPTYFHPSRDDDVFQWQNRMRELKRRFLFSFAVSRKRCRFLECDQTQSCYKPESLMKLLQSSIFCLQPPGDSYTRRSIFDSILAGCVPVFFHPGSAYVQYLWHFPKDYTKYSALIPASARAKRDEVIKLIPNVIYADPASRLQTIEDAFNLTVKGVLDRVETMRNQMKDGKEVNSEFPEQESWKYFTFGKLGGYEWDPFFSSKLGKRGT